MRISSSTVELSASRAFSVERTERERLRAWVEQPSTGAVVELSAEADFATRREALAASARTVSVKVAVGAASLGAGNVSDIAPGHETEETTDTKEAVVDFREGLKFLLLAKLLGVKLQKKLEFGDPAKAAKEGRKAGEFAAAQAARAEEEARSRGQREGFGVAYDLHVEVVEMERTSFAAAGTVTTSDGREISVESSLVMERVSAAELDVHVRAGDAVRVDPLVLNDGRASAGVVSTPVQFDLNADGSQEEIAGLAPGSSFLALDRDGNGTIQDGSELFGARTGDGFSELRAFDGDQNNWIDEADAVFKELRLLDLGQSGTQQISTLKQRNVGAIYLGSAATPFALQAGDSSKPAAEVRQSSIYLAESGEVGTVQHVDFFV